MSARKNSLYMNEDLFQNFPIAEDYETDLFPLSPKNVSRKFEDELLGEELDILHPEEQQPSVFVLEQEPQVVKRDSIEEKLQTEREKILEKYNQVVAERVEIRRKNIYLQKQLAEHYVKRRMEHVFKDDPEAFDMQGKYLKRLYELQDYKKEVENELMKVKNKKDECEKENDFLKQQLDELKQNLWNRQRKVGTSVLLKNGKKIGAKVVDDYIAQQSCNAEKFGRLTLREVTLLNKIEEKQETFKKRDNIGNNLSRADYQQLRFEYESKCAKLEEKKNEIERFKEKLKGHNQVVQMVFSKRDQIAVHLQELKKKKKNIQIEFAEEFEVYRDLAKSLKQLVDKYEKLKKSTGILLHEQLICDFEKSVKESRDLQKILDECKNFGLATTKKNQK